MRAIVIMATAAALAGCMPTVNQTTWSAADRGGQVTLTAYTETAQNWVSQCKSQRTGLELSALGTVGLSLASGTAAGATLALEGTNQTAAALGAVVGGLLSAYLGVRTWYGARLYSTMCMAYEGVEVPPPEE